MQQPLHITYLIFHMAVSADGGKKQNKDEKWWQNSDSNIVII